MRRRALTMRVEALCGHIQLPGFQYTGVSRGFFASCPVFGAPLFVNNASDIVRQAHFSFGIGARDIMCTMNRRRDGFVSLVTRKSIRLFALDFVCHTSLFHVKQCD